MKHLIGQTRNHVAVHVDLIGSEAAKHISQQPYLLGLVAEAIKQVALRGPAVSIEHDMGRTIGYNFVIPTDDADTVFYAQLLRDETYTRFIKNGKPVSTKYLTLVLERNEDGSYQLLDTWIGRLSPPRPGSANETAESKPYWASHAFILGNQTLQLRTVTKVCPY